MHRLAIFKRHWKISVAAVVGILAIAVIGLWFDGNNQATLNNNISNNQVSAPLADQTLTNSYFSFTYPGLYHVQSSATQPPDLADYTLTADTSYTKQLTAVLINGGVNDSSAYLLRKTRSDIYSSQPVTVAGDAASLWTKSDGSEETIFIPHGNQLLTLSFSVQNSNATDGLSSEVTNVLASLHWQ